MRGKKKREMRIQIDGEIKTQSDTEATAFRHKQGEMTSGERTPRRLAGILGPIKRMCHYILTYRLIEGTKCLSTLQFHKSSSFWRHYGLLPVYHSWTWTWLDHFTEQWLIAGEQNWKDTPPGISTRSRFAWFESGGQHCPTAQDALWLDYLPASLRIHVRGYTTSHSRSNTWTWALRCIRAAYRGVAKWFVRDPKLSGFSSWTYREV